MRLEVTRKSDLAVQSLGVLAEMGKHGTGPVKGSVLAERVSASAGFLAQAMTPLVRAGWVRSDPGPTGGYTLVADLGSLSVLSVIEEIEGPTDDGQCVLADRPCDVEGPCALHPAWMRARTHMLDELRSLSVAAAAAGTA